MRLVTLVGATDLALWAARRDAQAKLPQVIRRLVHATAARVLRAGFRAGEGVQLGGWDGIVVVERGNEFIPDGTSAWEMGTTGSVKGKADGDYEKRLIDPGGIDPAQSAFIFVTPRRWSEKEDWAAARQAEGVWREVRAYDADDLEQWLEFAPAVHHWLSGQLGTQPEQAIDLESFWEDWAAVTQPTMTPEFVLSGRDDVVTRVHSWLRAEQTPLAIKAASRDESLAVFAAAVEQLPADERVAYLCRAIVVRELAAWHQLTASEEPLILIPVFDSRDAVARATRTGHRVLLPLGPADSESGNTLNVQRLSRSGAMRALVSSGVPEELARELASLARRSLTSFRRKLALSPEVQQPEWARPAEARHLLAALLAGAWGDAAEGDREAISLLTQAPYEEVSRTLVRWANESDPPVRNVSGAWFIVSKEDVWSLLSRYLTVDDIRRFEQVVIDVLGAPDPRFDMPKDQRYMAGLLGHTPQHSNLLREELANTLAFMRSRGETLPLARDLSTREIAARVVRRLLEQARADWRVWASLSRLLPLLAEAAPDVFLQAAEECLAGDDPVLLKLFTEYEKGLFGNAPHAGLLWALETLAWDPEHLARAAVILARLTRLEPESNSANRAEESLRGIFLLWLPQTAATLEQRLRVLDLIREREPEVAWGLLRQLLPEDHGVGHSAATPRWREWAKPSLGSGPPADYTVGAKEVVKRVLDDVGESGPRWADLIWAVPELEGELYEDAIERLANIDAARLPPSDRGIIWNALRRFISRHRSFPDADWSLPKEQLDRICEIFSRFEPQEHVSRYGWLFDYSPSLPEGLEGDYEKQEREIERARLYAVRDIYQQAGIVGVLELVRDVEQPFQLGAALGESDIADDEEDELLQEYLVGGDPARAQLARGLAFGRYRSRGTEWIGTKLISGRDKWFPAQNAEFIICLPANQRPWEIAELLGPETDRAYWRLVNPYMVREAGAAHAAGKLLAHDRPHAAFELLGLHVRRDTGVPVTLIAEVLERISRPSPEDDRPSNSFSFHLSRLLNFLAESTEVDESRVARLEWVFLPVLGGFERKPEILHRELARNPHFFSELISLIFRAEGEEPREVSTEEEDRATRAYRLLHTWRTVPGTLDGGALDAEALRDWVRRTRELTAESGRRPKGDAMLGEVLSGSTYGEDGTWPHPAVCAVIEEAASLELEHGIEVGAHNSRGVVTKSLNEGGVREREIAERYAGFAATVRDRWPRTSAMLKRISEDYYAQAKHEDQDVRLRDELDR